MQFVLGGEAGGGALCVFIKGGIFQGLNKWAV